MRTQNVVRRALLVGVLAVLLGLAGGCTSPESQAASGPASTDAVSAPTVDTSIPIGELQTRYGFTPDDASLRRPLDNLIGTTRTTNLLTHVDDIFMRDCMAKQGFTYAVLPIVAHTPVRSDISDFGPRSVDEARRQAFAINPETEYKKVAMAMQKQDAAEMTPAKEKVWESCGKEPHPEVPSLPQADAVGLRVEATAIVRSDRNLQAAEAQWATCMRNDHSFSKPFKNRDEFFHAYDPVWSASKPHSTALMAEAPADPPPSAAEVAAAIADVDCKQRTGWAAKRYQTEWQSELRVMDKRAAILAKARTDNEVFLAKLQKVLQAHGEQLPGS